MFKSMLPLMLLSKNIDAFPWVIQQPGVDTHLLGRQTSTPSSSSDCPFNPNHPGAAPITPEFPYAGAQNGLPGNGRGGILVPDPNDAAHQYTPPDYSVDIRGPCPGTNTLANHNFISHDGIVTFEELVDAQQNVYNLGYDLAVFLATLGITLSDGDPITQKLSIGCDATSRTSFSTLLFPEEPGLNGHNHFETDASLTRNDFFTHDGDNYRFNGSLFAMMQDTCQGSFTRSCLASYRSQRWHQSQAENPNFYAGPTSLLLYGAASFLYTAFPSGTHGYAPDLDTISSFFGTEQSSDGEWVSTGGERIPENWTSRTTPYAIPDIVSELLQMYLEDPVAFGGNTGPGVFDAITGPGVDNGNLTAGTPAEMTCLLYQLATERVPSSLTGFLEPTVDALSFATGKLNNIFSNFGCPIPLKKREMAETWLSRYD